MKQEIVYKSVKELVPYARNSRTHSDEQVSQIMASIKEFGFTNPILTDGENGIIAGHGRVMAAQRIGLNEVPTIELSHLTEAQKKAYIIADNKLALNSGWDEEMLKIELSELEDIGFNMDLTGFDKIEIDALFGDEDNTHNLNLNSEYTQKIESPTYEPSENKPNILELYDISKTNALIERIQNSSVDKEIKEFLIIAAQRHTVLNFRLIADYYSNADKETQELMEDSALVIIDFNKAIANGYVKLSKAIDDIYSEEHLNEE